MKATLRSARRPITALALVLFLEAGAPAATLYVNVNNTTPVSPFTNWAGAAQVIQDAVDAAQAGDTVLVTNGVYGTGGRAVFGTMTNRVAVTKAVTVRSVNGPAVTQILGYQMPGTTNGDGAIRCAYLTNAATIIGFTLANGATHDGPWDDVRNYCGGGVFCESGGAFLTDCLLAGNSATGYGGAVYLGTLKHCTLVGNNAYAGGGAFGASLDDCILIGNSAGEGGGTLGGALNNCTLAANYGFDAGGGANSSKLTNSILYYNESSNYHGPTFNHVFCILEYCCTMPRPVGTSNVTNAPSFVDTNGWSNLRLQINSPCINAGNNAYVTNTTDQDGNPRIVNGTVDMGAFEWQVPVRLAALAPPGPDGLPLSLTGETNRVYALHASSNLTTWSWLAWLTNSSGQSTYTDSLSPLPPARFYKALPIP
ncbi:MAG: hypothetical protein HZA90_05875 [Verrucomicrobia bacterium]|nr:hypothetical protein [Verrucomicrobiota bacterium]